jgi:hypothetical protein
VLCLHEEGRSPIYQEITASCPGQIARPLPEGTNPVGVCHDEPVEKYTQMFFKQTKKLCLVLLLIRYDASQPISRVYKLTARAINRIFKVISTSLTSSVSSSNIFVGITARSRISRLALLGFSQQFVAETCKRPVKSRLKTKLQVFDFQL